MAASEFLRQQILFCSWIWYLLLTVAPVQKQPPEVFSKKRCSVRKVVLRNFAKLTGKHKCQSLFFNKVAGLRSAVLLKKRLWHRCFPVNFAKFLRAPFFGKHVQTAASASSCSGLLWKHQLNLRSSHKLLCKKGILRKFANFTGEQLCWSLFLIELVTFRLATLLKRDSNTDVFLWNLRDF